jgi:hypothetical protein
LSALSWSPESHLPWATTEASSTSFMDRREPHFAAGPSGRLGL